MNSLMPQLHPSLRPGPFDVTLLLKHNPPESWRPEEEGEMVHGVVVRVSKSSRDDYDFPVLDMFSDDRLIRVRCSPTMLKKQVAEQRIRVGSIISIRFDGEAVSQEGRTYKLYTVRSV